MTEDVAAESGEYMRILCPHRPWPSPPETLCGHVFFMRAQMSMIRIDNPLEGRADDFLTLNAGFRTGHDHGRHVQGEVEFQPGQLGPVIPEEPHMDLSSSAGQAS